MEIEDDLAVVVHLVRDDHVNHGFADFDFVDVGGHAGRHRFEQREDHCVTSPDHLSPTCVIIHSRVGRRLEQIHREHALRFRAQVGGDRDRPGGNLERGQVFGHGR